MKHYALLFTALILTPVVLFSGAVAQDAKDGEKPAAAGEAKEIDKKALEKLAKTFGEWLGLKETSNLKELKKLKKVEEDLGEQLEEMKKAGHDWLRNPSVLRQILVNEKRAKWGRNASGKKKFAIGKDEEVEFAVRSQKGYRPSTPTPVVLCLHPLQSRFGGNDYIRSMFTDKELLNRLTLVAPEAPKPKKAKKGEPEPAPFDWAKREYLVYSLGTLGFVRLEAGLALNTDHNRLYLDGYGTGGTSAWKIASGFASLFAGVVIRGAMPPEGTRFEDFKHTPFLLYGLADQEMDTKKVDEVAAKMKAAGVDVTVVKIEDFKPLREKVAFKDTPKEVIAFFEKTRNPYPTTIDWSIKETHTRTAFYVKSLNEIEDETLPEKKRGQAPNFQVSVDRSKNRITITSHRIEKFRIYLNDAIVDLDKPVTVEVNKKVVYNGKLEASRDSLIDNWEVFGDNWASYPADLEVEVPAEIEPEKKDEKKDEAQPSVKPDGK